MIQWCFAIRANVVQDFGQGFAIDLTVKLGLKLLSHTNGVQVLPEGKAPRSQVALGI
jgi:hypothetical protein